MPSYSTGFWVAMIMNGRGRMRVSPSTVTWPSSMHSSSADWVLGEARLISSTRITLAKTGPGRKTNDAGVLVPHRDAGHVGRQQVRGALEPRVVAPGGAREALGQHRLAHPGHVLDHHVPARQEGDDAGLDRGPRGAHGAGARVGQGAGQSGGGLQLVGSERRRCHGRGRAPRVVHRRADQPPSGPAARRAVTRSGRSAGGPRRRGSGRRTRPWTCAGAPPPSRRR